MTTVIADSTSFMDVVWWMLIFMAFVIWVWLAITVFTDIFRRHDSSGWAKAAWIILIIVFPYLGVFIYLIAEHAGMADRNQKALEQAQSQFDAEVRRAAGTADDPAEQIKKAHDLLDQGAISQKEFEGIKNRALGGLA